MKNLGIQLFICTVLWFALLCTWASCEFKAHKPINSSLVPSTNNVYTDSAYADLAQAFNEKKMMVDTLQRKCDSLKYLSDSLKVALFNEGYKVENVKNYIKIVKHNPSQMKFFLGWVDRAVR